MNRKVARRANKHVTDFLFASPFHSAAKQQAADKTGTDAKEDVVVDTSEFIKPHHPLHCLLVIFKQTYLLLNQVVDEVAEKEGVPAALLPEINNVVNDEFNKM